MNTINIYIYKLLLKKIKNKKICKHINMITINEVCIKLFILTLKNCNYKDMNILNFKVK